MLRRTSRSPPPGHQREQDIAGPAVAARGADRSREAKRPRYRDRSRRNPATT